MHGPKSPGFWSADAKASWEFLQRGKRYRVVKAFVDQDGDTHAPGETWTFVGSAFQPQEDGLSLFVQIGDAEWQIRLQDRPEAQQAVVDDLAEHVRPGAP